MYTYLIINAAIIIVPLLLSFEKKISFYKKTPAYFFSISIVSSIYISWDVIATIYEHWGFNSDYTIKAKLFSLPIEEVLFFITVPYSSLFIYETISYYIKDKKISFNKIFYIVLSIFLIITAIIFSNQYYTFTVLLFCAGFFLISSFLHNTFLNSRNYWIFILLTFLPFLIVNYILTSLPIVWYNSKAIWGIRFLTIPFEDFFYSFSMISFWLLSYKLFLSKHSEAK